LNLLDYVEAGNAVLVNHIIANYIDESYPIEKLIYVVDYTKKNNLSDMYHLIVNHISKLYIDVISSGKSNLDENIDITLPLFLDSNNLSDELRNIMKSYGLDEYLADKGGVSLGSKEEFRYNYNKF